ncbi:MAG: F0F1 ATP synthase subunit A [Candidatus Dormibacteria bacterium]
MTRTLATAVSPEPYTHPIIGKGFLALNVDTVRNSLIVAAILVIAGIAIRMRSRGSVPGHLQNLLEYFVDAVAGLVRGTLGNRPVRIVPVCITMFAFILLANLLGLIPFFKSPTNDLNTTLGLALFAVYLVHRYSIRARGVGGWAAHFFSLAKNPVGRVLLGLLEVMQEVFKPITMSMRLFFNIFVGELLLAVMLVLLGPVSPVFNGIFWIPFSAFIGLIQAFIFVMLTISYVSQGVDTHDDHAAAEAP